MAQNSPEAILAMSVFVFGIVVIVLGTIGVLPLLQAGVLAGAAWLCMMAFLRYW